MGRPAGFLEIDRALPEPRDVQERLNDFDEVDNPLSVIQARDQSARCMDCGVPFCHTGCPLGNVIPDFNQLVYEDRWRLASEVLHATNNFPEITGRICPAPCEAACVLNIEQQPVTIERIEAAIADRAFEEGWLAAQEPAAPSGQHVAIVGSGPAGLACAQQLVRQGHAVTVFERDDRVGGLLRYGIPDFKLNKRVLDRRIAQLVAEGVRFRTGVQVERDRGPVSIESLRAEHDAVVVAIGATVARDLPIPGRDLGGVHLAMQFLVPQNRVIAGDVVSGQPSAAGKHVVILGGGDTGSDCLGTALRQGARSVIQIELMPKPPIDDRAAWPEWPMILRTSSSQQEGGARDWAVLTQGFVGSHGNLTGLRAVRCEFIDGRPRGLKGTEFEIPAELCLLALGFTGPSFEVSGAGAPADVFTCGDARRGQSLVVWAIAEGRACAADVHRFLHGRGS